MTRAAIYCRISDDREGAEKGVTRQREDCLVHADRLGFDVVAEYTDNDTGASTRSRKARPNFDAMLAEVKAGRLDAIVAYSNSRLTRRPAEWLTLINLANEGRLRIATVASGEHDLSTADGRAVALTIAAWDGAEAERTSERVARAARQRREAGRPQPGRFACFGYTKAFEPIEEEAAVVRRIFAARVEGRSVQSICNELNREGITTNTGRAWTGATLAGMLARPGYAGLVLDEDGAQIATTTYRPLVDLLIWHAAQQVRTASGTGTNARSHLMSGIARCGRCSTGLVGNAAIGQGSYRCLSKAQGGCGGSKIKASDLDDVVVSLVLARETAAQGLPRVSEITTEHRAELTRLDGEIEAARGLYASGDLALADLTPILRDLRRKRGEVEQAGARVVSEATGSLVTHAQWLDLDLSARRALILRHVDSVVVGPAKSRGRQQFDPSRLTIRWRDGEAQVPTRDDLGAIPHRDSERGLWRYPEGTASTRLAPVAVA